MFYYGYNSPFFGGHQNVLSRQSGDQLVKNDLLQLLLTSPGERVRRPDFGTILKQSLFEPMTADKVQEIRSNVGEAIRRFEKRVKVSVNVVSDPDSNLLSVHLVGNYTDAVNDQFVLELNLPLNNVSR